MANNTGRKFGGRTKGTPNKQTKEIRKAIQTLIENNIDNFDIWIDRIAQDNPEKAIELIIKLTEYVIPKLSRTEIKELSIDDLIQMPQKERQQRIVELKTKLSKNGL